MRNDLALLLSSAGLPEQFILLYLAQQAILPFFASSLWGDPPCDNWTCCSVIEAVYFAILFALSLKLEKHMGPLDV